MNCFEARTDFAAFWQKTMTPERRQRLVEHLSGCPGCDHSFRLFALTAPALYSQTEPPTNSAKVQARLSPAARSTSTPATERRFIVRMIGRAAAASLVAAAAAIALYFAAPPHMTFEDAIGADYSTVEPANYPSTDSFFGRELLANDNAQDFADD